MPIVEKYGLGVLFVLCGFIVLVGMFAENPTRKAAEKLVLEQNKQTAEREDLGDYKKDMSKPDKDEFPGFGDPPKKRGAGLKPVLPDPNRRRSFPMRDKKKAAPLSKKEAPKLAAKAREHKLQRHESFWTLAGKYYGNRDLFQHIADANPELSAMALLPGTMVKIPELGGSKKKHTTPRKKVVIRHKIVKGDNLSTLAQRFLGSMKYAHLIAEANNMTIDGILNRGTILIIPRKQ